MKNSNKLIPIVSSVLIASGVTLINGCCTSHKGGGGTAYYSNYETPPPAQTTTTETKPAETAGGEVVIPLYQENVSVGKREVDAGSVTIKKVVKTETVNQPVELRRETISIDKQPGSGTGQSADQSKAFTEQQFTIQLKKEEPVMQKQVVQTGRAVVSKQSQTEQTTVQGEIRKEDVAVDKGNAQDVKISQGGAGSPGGESEGSASSGTITDLKTLAQTTDVESMHGKMVQCSNVKVQQVMDPTLITVGGEGNQPEVCVHLQQPTANLKPGDTVTITGTVKESSKSTDITGGLSNTASQALNSHRFFIEAKSCQKGG
jgi:uncharacterized protein (TIGR02271 family)